MQVQVPSERLTAQWNLGAWHLLRHCEKNPKNGRLWFNDYPYGILAAETYMVLAALDLMGSHQAAEDGFDQWTSLPMDPNSGRPSRMGAARPAQRTLLRGARMSDARRRAARRRRPHGRHPCLRPGLHRLGPDRALLADRRYRSGSKPPRRGSRPTPNGCCVSGRWSRSMVPGGERLWCKGLQPALQATPDSGGLWMQFYECEAYYWVFRLAIRGRLERDRSRRRRQTQGRGRGLSQRPAGGGRAVHRALAGGSGARRHLPFGHSVRLLRARAEHGGLGLAARRLRRACRPAVLGNGPVGGAADQPGGTVVAQGRAGAGISRRAGRSVALGECRMSEIGTGSTPAGSIRADWNAPRTCTWPATTSRSFSARS